MDRADLAQHDLRGQVWGMLAAGWIIVEMHDAGCRADTQRCCLVVLEGPDGTLRTLRAEAEDLLEPEYRCVCSQYR